MALDLSGIIQSAPQLLRDLTLMVNLMQLIFYAGLVLTFGGLIMRAYKGYLSRSMKVVGRVVFGFLALVCGIGISWLIPSFSSVPVYAILQVIFFNIIIGSAVSALVIYAVLRMISYNVFNIPGIEKRMKRLDELKSKGIEVQKKEHASGRAGIRHPIRLAGVAGLAVFLVVGLAGFQGFPNVLAELGFTQQDLDSMAEQVEYVNEEYGDRIGEVLGNSQGIEECIGAASLLQDHEALSSMEPYTGSDVEEVVESYTGEAVIEMYRIRAGDDFYFLAFTQSRTCLATRNMVCLCEETENIL